MLNALLDRRRLLLGLAAAPTAAAAPAAVRATAPTENPKLLRLADQLDAAIAKAAAARAHKQAVIDKWWWKWPTAPDAICYGYAKHQYTAEAETGLTGARILANGASVPALSSRSEAGPGVAGVAR